MAIRFDPHNIDHCRAYRHLQKTGQWPDGIEFHGVQDDPLWQISLIGKMANIWIDHKIESDDYAQKNEEIL